MICLDGAQLDVQRGQQILVLILGFLGFFRLDLFFQILDLGVEILDLLLQLVHLQLLLVDGQAQGVRVIRKELLVDPDLVAGGHIQLLDLLVGIPVDFNNIFADDNTGEFIGAGGGGGQQACLLHIDLGIGGAAGQSEDQRGTQSDQILLHVHRESPPFQFPYDIMIMIRFFPGHVNRYNYKEL